MAADFALRDRAADFLHLGDVLDGVHLLHILRLDLRQPERVEPFARKLGVVARVGKSFGTSWISLADDVANLAIERIARQAFSENAAKKILLVEAAAISAEGMVPAL